MTKIQNISLSANEKISLVSNFSTMLSAGIPILETVDALLDGAKGNQKKLLDTVRADLIEGKHIYTSFSKFPQVFDKVTVNLIKASEEAGTLDVALEELKESIKKQAEFSDKIRSAMVYPVIIIVVFGMVLLLMLTFVIPKISSVFLRLNVELPLPTKVLIFASNIILQQTIPFLVSCVFLIVFLAYLYRTQKRMFLHILTSIPGLTGLAKEIDLTRFSHSLYLLLNAGIPITTALELAQDVVINKDIAKTIHHCKESVYAGRRLSEALRDYKDQIPTMVIKITEAGEKTGTLDKSMQDISEYLDYEVSKNLRTTTALIEPILLVVVGILIGGMMLGIIAPIYGLISQLTPS